MTDTWGGLSVLGENPQQPLGRISPGRGQAVAQVFEPILVVGISNTVNIPQREDEINGFEIPQGTLMLMIYGKITGVGGGGAALYLYDTVTSPLERAFAVSHVAGFGGGANTQINPSRGTVAWRVDKGGATSFAGGIYITGLIRNP